MEEYLNQEFDLIVIGTGLTESLLAAAGARIGKRVLHLDRNSYYGGLWSSFSLSGLEDWANSIGRSSDKKDVRCPILEDNETWINLSNPNSVYQSVNYGYLESFGNTVGEQNLKQKSSNMVASIYQPESDCGTMNCWTRDDLYKQSRKFNIDLAPKLLYSRGPMVELLISSNVARYLEFKCLTRVLTLMEKSEPNLVVVPCSRSDVFTTNILNLVEKRLLMKFLQFCHRYQENRNQWEEFADKPFKEFLIQQKLTSNLIHFVINAIAMVNDTTSCSEGLHQTNLFLCCLGRYGSMPFLFSIYGSGEMPQAFCRLCAVYEGVYMLRKSVEGLVVNNDTKQVCSIVSDGELYKCKSIIMDAGYYYHEIVPGTTSRKSISRAVLVTDRSILGNDKENVTLLMMPADNGINVTVIELGPASGVCTKDTFLVHLTCEGQDAENDLQVIVQKLFKQNDIPDEEIKPRILFYLYFNRIIDSTEVDNLPNNLFLCSGPDAELDYDFAIEQAKNLFGKIFPNEEFLPRAPDPDEIVFEGEVTKDNNFDFEPSEEMKELLDETIISEKTFIS